MSKFYGRPMCTEIFHQVLDIYDRIIARELNRHQIRYVARQTKNILKESMRGNIHSPTTARALCRTFCHSEFKRYIVFLVSGYNDINGGWMSIFSVAKETMRFSEIHRAKVAICTAIGETPLRRYTKFDNSAVLFPFNDFLNKVEEKSKIMIHVPECFVDKYICKNISFFKKANVEWHFNILLQNIDFIPSFASVSILRELGTVTATVAHAAYANEQTGNRMGCPTYLLSTWICPEEYHRTSFNEKDRIIVVSPDKNPLKRQLIQRIALCFPDHKIIEIKNMTYRQYRNIILRAKFTFTFGEGLDGYFAETIFSGGVGMAIYNNRFFTPDYRNLEGIFYNLERDLNCITDFMISSNNAQKYNEIAGKQFAILSKKYVRAEYLNNLKSFYSQTFTS